MTPYYNWRESSIQMMLHRTVGLLVEGVSRALLDLENNPPFFIQRPSVSDIGLSIRSSVFRYSCRYAWYMLFFPITTPSITTYLCFIIYIQATLTSISPGRRWWIGYLVCSRVIRLVSYPLSYHEAEPGRLLFAFPASPSRRK